MDDYILVKPRLLIFEQLAETKDLISKRENLFEDFKKVRQEMLKEKNETNKSNNRSFSNSNSNSDLSPSERNRYVSL